VCLEQVRIYAEKQIESEIDWYRRNVRGTRFCSRSFRAVAIIFTTMGGLVPVLKSTGAFDLLAVRWTWLEAGNFDVGQLGYVFLAIAGGVAFFDRFFGFSTAWMRYIAAMCALERVREMFRLEWVSISRPRVGAVDDTAGRLLDVAKRLVLKAKELSERETEAWIQEFRMNLAQLEKDLRAQVEASRPGAIDIKVKDGSHASAGIDVRLDQFVVEHVSGATASIAQVTPGHHKVSVSTELSGRTYLASQIVNVAPGEVATVELELGIQPNPPPTGPPSKPSAPAPKPGAPAAPPTPPPASPPTPL
jgi:hypothetical protein